MWNHRSTHGQGQKDMQLCKLHKCNDRNYTNTLPKRNIRLLGGVGTSLEQTMAQGLSQIYWEYANICQAVVNVFKSFYFFLFLAFNGFGSCHSSKYPTKQGKQAVCCGFWLLFHLCWFGSDGENQSQHCSAAHSIRSAQLWNTAAITALRNHHRIRTLFTQQNPNWKQRYGNCSW